MAPRARRSATKDRSRQRANNTCGLLTCTICQKRSTATLPRWLRPSKAAPYHRPSGAAQTRRRRHKRIKHGRASAVKPKSRSMPLWRTRSPRLQRQSYGHRRQHTTPMGKARAGADSWMGINHLRSHSAHGRANAGASVAGDRETGSCDVESQTAQTWRCNPVREAHRTKQHETEVGHQLFLPAQACLDRLWQTYMRVSAAQPSHATLKATQTQDLSKQLACSTLVLPTRHLIKPSDPQIAPTKNLKRARPGARKRAPARWAQWKTKRTVRGRDGPGAPPDAAQIP